MLFLCGVTVGAMISTSFFILIWLDYAVRRDAKLLRMKRLRTLSG